MNTDCHFDVNGFVEDLLEYVDLPLPLSVDPPLQPYIGHRVAGKPAYCAYCNSPDHNRTTCDAPEELRVSYYLDRVLGESYNKKESN